MPGFGRVPCPARGIVEPIVFAMQFAMQHFGDVMDPFVDEAITDGDPALLMRLYVAASSLEEISDPEIRTCATRMTEQLSASLDEIFQKIHAPDQGESEDPQVGS